jgi:hypothetical protein
VFPGVGVRLLEQGLFDRERDRFRSLPNFRPAHVRLCPGLESLPLAAFAGVQWPRTGKRFLRGLGVDLLVDPLFLLIRERDERVDDS